MSKTIFEWASVLGRTALSVVDAEIVADSKIGKGVFTSPFD
jgi:hypothetical protein